MMPQNLRSTVMIAALCALPNTAMGYAEYQSQIPSQPGGCQTCHTEGGGSPRNPFGLDVEATLINTADGTFVAWSDLWNVDSDGDGQSNGMELGDPCGEWSEGAAPRTDEISLPGNEFDDSLDPLTGCTDGNVPPDTRTPRPPLDNLEIDTTPTSDSGLFDVGGCFGNLHGNHPNSSVWTLVALLGGIGVWGRRRKVRTP